MLDVSGDYQEALGRFSEQNTALSEDPALLLDDEWTIRTAGSTIMIQDASTRVLEYEPVPERLVAFHDRFKEAAQEFSDAMGLYRMGIDARNADLLGESLALFNDANAIIEEIGQQIPELRGQ